MSRNPPLVEYLPKANRRPAREKRPCPREELQILREIGETILTSSDIQVVLMEILDKVLSTGSFDLGVIGLVRRNSDGMEPVAHRGFRNPKQIHACFPKVHRLMSRASPDPSSPPRTLIQENIPKSPGKEWMKREGVRSFIEISIVAENKCLGAIQLGSRIPRKFQDREIRFLKTLGCQIGIAVQKARRAIHAQRTTEVQELLKELNQEITVLDVDSLLEKLQNKVREIFEVDGIKVRALRGQKGVDLKPTRPPEAEGKSFSRRSRWIREHRQPLMIPDITQETSTFRKVREEDDGMRAYLGVPIFSKTGEVIGILRVSSKQARRFRPAEINLLQQLADGLAAIFENARLLEETRRRVQEQAALNAIATAAGQSLHLNEILQLSLDKVLQVTGRERGYIRLKEPTTHELILAAYRGISKEYADILLYNRTLGGKSDQVFETGRSLIINDPQGTTLKKETLDEGIRSIAWVPMKAAGKVVGILNISTALPKSFEPREVELLEAIANVIGNAVENSRLFLETLARAKEICALYDVSTIVNRSLDLNPVLQQVLRKIMDIFRFDAARVYLFRPEAGELHLHAALDTRTESLFSQAPRVCRPGEGSIGKAFQNGEPVIVSDIRHDPRYESNGLSDVMQRSGFNFFATFPIRTQLKPVGVLSLIGSVARYLTSAEIRLLTSMTDQIGVTVDHARLYEEIKKQARELEKTNTELRRRENVESLLKELSLDITSLDIEQLLKKLTEKARDFFAADVCSVRVKDRESWKLMGVSGTAPENLLGGNDQTRGRTQWIIENRKPLLIPDMAQDGQVPSTGSGRLASFRSYMGVPLLSRAGEVIGVLRLLSYQTRNFAAEEVELLQQLANGAALALENARLLEQIRRQALELERTSKVKDEFLDIVSHELRTPLSAVMGYAALMQDGVLGELQPQFCDALEKIENQTQILLTMINSILEVTSIQAGATVVQYRETDLKALLDDIRSIYDFSLKKDVAFFWDYDGDLPRIATDPAKLKRILENLMNNAIKFTQVGRITLSARYLSRLQRVEFQVSDTGVGILPEMQPAIFERFRQADSSHTRLYGGVGLGLYIAKSFTQMLGGALTVASEPGTGSIFTITLPYEKSLSRVGDHSTPLDGGTSLESN